MAAFDLEMASPVTSGYVGDAGGPKVGGHRPGSGWAIEFGMDLKAPPTTQVFIPFDGHITSLIPHDKKKDSSTIYGAQITMRSANDLMGAYFTHITAIPAEIRPGMTVSRGDKLGQILPGAPTHLHVALCEIRGGGRFGVDIFKAITKISGTSDVIIVTFPQDGTPPTVRSA